jgi:hypothetical protein
MGGCVRAILPLFIWTGRLAARQCRLCFHTTKLIRFVLCLRLLSDRQLELESSKRRMIEQRKKEELNAEAEGLRQWQASLHDPAGGTMPPALTILSEHGGLG